MLTAFTMIRDRLADRVVTTKDGQVEARCPAHEDRRASLGLGVRAQGDPGAVVCCQAGCDTDAIMAALGLPMAALYDSHWQHENGNGTGSKIVASYDYVDEAGELLYQVVRFEPKDFRQRRPDGNGRWSWKLGGVERVLYRLPAVVEAVEAERRVFVVEGEKDVHALEAVGEVATCNPGGAGKWRPEYGKALAGAEVVVVADRDAPGRKHAETVRKSLKGVAADAVVVEPAEGKDAADHLAAGHDADKFVPVEIQEEIKAAPMPAQDTGELLTDVEAFVRRFVVLPGDASYLTATLYVAHTWAFDAAHATPYLVVESPEKQSGKTRLLEVLELICRNPVKVASITAAALFQTVGYGTPTLMIDEADAIFAGNSERSEDLRGVLNAGNAPGSVVIRGGRDGTPVSYPVFCPKVIAGIATGRLPDTIRDRAIVVAMDRKLKSERVERLRRRRIQVEVDGLRGRLQAWAGQNTTSLERFELAAEIEQISDRMEEAWEPLLAIAEIAGGGYPERAREAALGLDAADEDDGATSANVLLFALRDVFADREAMFSRQLVADLNDNDELPFAGWSDGKGIKQAEIARLLKRYRVKSRTVRVGSATAMGYRREQFEAAWERYGGDFANTSHTTHTGRGNPPDREPTQTTQCVGSENAGIAREHCDVSDVLAKSRSRAPDDEKAVLDGPLAEPKVGPLDRAAPTVEDNLIAWERLKRMALSRDPEPPPEPGSLVEQAILKYGGGQR